MLEPYAISEDFGLRKHLKDPRLPLYRRPIPGYFRLDWEVEEDDDNWYDDNYPPNEGEFELSYFTTDYWEWKKIFMSYVREELTWEETQRHVRKVRFRTFPAAFELWDRLIETFFKGLGEGRTERDAVIQAMLQASERHNGGGRLPL